MDHDHLLARPGDAARNRHHADCRASAERYTLICDGPHMRMALMAVRAILVTNLTAARAITAKTAQVLLTPNHGWQLNDSTTGTVTTAKDTVGTLNAAGAGNALWKTGDLYSPDVTLDGTNSVLTTSGPALPTNADFAVSAWVKPSDTGGVVLSQDGTQASGFKLWAESSDSSWRFAMATTDTASPGYDTAAAPANSVRLGVWTHLIATYKRSTGAMTLYVNGANTDTATATHTTTWNATGPFQIGDYLNNSTHTGYLAGQIADVQTYNQTITPPAATFADPPQRVWYEGVGGFDAKATRLVAGDFNGDGRADVAAEYDYGSGNTGLFVWWANPDGTFSNAQRVWFENVGGFAAGATRLVAGDFNGDGRADMAAEYDRPQAVAHPAQGGRVPGRVAAAGRQSGSSPRGTGGAPWGIPGRRRGDDEGGWPRPRARHGPGSDRC
jgi:hypothetical protein